MSLGFQHTVCYVGQECIGPAKVLQDSDPEKHITNQQVT